MSDLIKRSDAIEAIAKTIAYDGDTSAWLYVAEDMLKGAPSADRPQGEWLCSDDSYENAVCSNCGFDSGESYVVVKYEQKWKACPICEARMEGADDE